MDINAGSYVSLSLTPQSADKLHAWAVEQGIPEVFEPHDFHITICFSTRPLHYVPLGRIPLMPVKPLELDLFGKEKNYLVLKVKSSLANNRHEYAMLSGAHDAFPEYKPHISLSKNAEGVDLKKIGTYPDLLYVNRETHIPLDPGFKPEALRVNPIALQKLLRSETLEASIRSVKVFPPTPERLDALKAMVKAAGIKARFKKQSGSLTNAVAIRLDSAVNAKTPDEGARLLKMDKEKIAVIGANLGLMSSSTRLFSDPDIANAWNGHEINVYFTH